MLSLYREMLREAGKITDYNYRYVSQISRFPQDQRLS